MLERVDGHALVVNSAAMKAAGVTAATPAPPGGRIENGLFVDNAKDLIEKAVPAGERCGKRPGARKGAGHPAELRRHRRRIDEHRPLQTGMRCAAPARPDGSMSVSWSMPTSSHLLNEVPQPTPWLYNDRLRMVGIKFYADGALGSRGAWLKRPYSDKPDTHAASQFHSDAEMRSLADTAASHGFQIATHAIGDAANAQVITTYEWLNGKYGSDRRWRIEHAQIVDCADLPRIGRAEYHRLDAADSPDQRPADGREAARARRACSAPTHGNRCSRTGARLAFGTDFPVESPNPFPGLSAAISRQDINGQPPGGWYPEERLTFEQALEAYTRGAAYAGFAEDRIGALEPGKWADFIIIDRDPTKVDAQQLARTEVLETWVGGKKVWSRSLALRQRLSAGNKHRRGEDLRELLRPACRARTTNRRVRRPGPGFRGSA